MSASAPVAGAHAYDEFAYPGYAYPVTHPARLEVLGRLFGLCPPPAETSRVLELGCGEATNALAIAHTLPHARVIGLDAAASGIERGRALGRAAGIENAELLIADLGDLEQIVPLGPFDYIVAHGVYSWIPPRLRGALLECCRRCLSPHGIAFVSYNAYPGSYLRDMARDVLTFHLRDVSNPADRLGRARALMDAIIAADDPTPYGKVLREQLQRMLSGGDALLYHDELAPISTPFYFHEFIEHATSHDLQFLSEASLADSQVRDVPQSVGRLIASLPSDVVVREQYLDFLRNRMFRQTLLVLASAPVQRAIDDLRLGDLMVSSPARAEAGRFVTPDGIGMSTTDPLLQAAMTVLCDAWPESLSFAELKARASRRVQAAPPSPADGECLRAALLELYLGRVVRLQSCALPVASAPRDRPQASGLARAQLTAGHTVLATLLAGNCVLDDPLERSLLPLLDGTRDRTALASAVSASPEELDATLASLAKHGLLCA